LVPPDGKALDAAAAQSPDAAAQTAEALAEAGAESGDSALKVSNEELAQLSGLKDVIAAVASPQANAAGAMSNTRAATERSAQSAGGQVQDSHTGIAATSTGAGLQSPGAVESTQHAALGGQVAAAGTLPLEQWAGGATQSNTAQTSTTHSSAHKRNHEEATYASSGTRVAQAVDGAAKAEKPHDGGSDAMTGNAASTAATTSAAVSAKAEASTPAQPVTAMASATMTAANLSGTMPARPLATASADTQMATLAASQGSTLDAAHLRTTTGGAELKVSVQLPELGRVEVRAVTSVNGTEAHLTTEHHAAAAALSSGRDGLEAALRTHDVTLGSLTTQSQSQGGHERNQPEPQRAGGTNSHARDTDGRQTTSAAESEATPLPEYASISVLV
jgi:flagellar hook-length control protein FliK